MELELVLDRPAHGAQMDRHERRIRDEVSRGGEHGARVVEPFLDVGGDGGLLQGPTHRLGNRHEAVGAARYSELLRWVPMRSGAYKRERVMGS
jgi:hypothetical protein